MIGGAIWGGTAGLLRAKTGGTRSHYDESCSNWIAIRLIDYLLATSYIQKEGRAGPHLRGHPGDGLAAQAAQLARSTISGPRRHHRGVACGLGFSWWLLFRSTIGFRVAGGRI